MQQGGEARTHGGAVGIGVVHRASWKSSMHTVGAERR